MSDDKVTTNVESTEVNTHCIVCGKELNPLQVFRKGKFCCRSCQISYSNKHRAKIKLSDEERKRRSEFMKGNQYAKKKTSKEGSTSE